MLAKKYLKAFLRRYPSLGILATNFLRVFRFRLEKRAFAGKYHPASTAPPSVVYFSHYRCASMMVNKRLRELMAGGGYQKMDYQGYVHPWPIEEREEFQHNQARNEKLGLFPSSGHYFGPLRYFVDIPKLQEMKAVVVLRDPRDVLVSRYYSEKFNHVRLDKRFREHCEKIEKMSLDEFVIAYKEDVKSHYSFYLENLDALSNALIISYEEMISDFHGFLKKLNDYLDLGKSDEFIRSISAKESFEVQAEDVYSHKRSVQPRNFEKKLSAETIGELNECFGQILSEFKWAV